jgi:hypothetical protein
MGRPQTIFHRACLGAALALAFAVTAHAQFRASVQGTVTDQSGAVVSEATVTLTNKETGRTQQTETSDEGFYRFSGLAPGEYTLTAELSGFKKTSLEITVNAEETQGADIALAAGEVSEVVTITDDSAPELETENANVTNAVTRAEVLRLPQFGRDPYELARLTPGVFGSGARDGSGGSVRLPNTSGPGGSNLSIFQTENQVPISANGQRLSANSFQVDGVSVNSQTWGGAAVITPSQEAVKEVRVSSATYSAEDGRNSGAVIKVVTQSGTNEFHGSAFFKYNDPGLNAFNRFPVTPSRVENKFRQFGGSIGGPVLRNKLFFFFAYEGLRNNTDVPFREWVETPDFRQLVIGARPGSIAAQILGAAGVEPRVIQILSAGCAEANLGDADCRSVSGGLDIGSPIGATGQYARFDQPLGGGFDGIPDIQYALISNPGRFRGHQFHTRVDYNITDNDRLAVTAIFVPTSSLGADTGGRSRPMADILSERLNYNLAVIYHRTIGATMLNEARFNVTRWSFDEVTSNPNVDFGIPRIEIEGYPFDRIRFGASRGEGTPGVFSEVAFEFGDTLSWVTGNHAFKFGAEIRREHNNNSLTGGARPLYSFSRLWNFVNDTPIFEAINADPNTGMPATGETKIRTGDYSFFVQDDWKARPNLTLNLGLRYEVFDPIHAADGQLGNLVFGPNGLVDARVELVDKLHKTDRNNFGPQIGFAWSPYLLEGKGVLRGGFGVAYNRLPNALLLNARANPPFFGRYNLCCGGSGGAGEEWATPFANGQITYALGGDTTPFNYPVHPALGQGIDPETGAPRSGAVEIYGTQPDQPNAYVYRYSLEGQYEMPGGLVATLGYQGSSTHKLVRIVNQNFIYEQTNPAFFAVYFAQPDVNANYNALNARLQKRFADGFSFDAIYRWSKSIDTVSYDAPTHLTNQTYPVDNSTERGPSDFDVAHYFVVQGLWDLPIFRTNEGWKGKILGGWQLNAILTSHTGFPWTPKIDASLRSPGGAFFGPIRPTAYFGGAFEGTSNDTFLRPGGNFPGGGANYFDLTINGDPPTYLENPPGIGRNVFRGPKYFNVDLSVVKRFGLPSGLGLGEGAGLDLRVNFFNVLNKLNLSPLLADSPGVFANRTQFGTVQSALAGRVVEFQARFYF